MDLFTSESSLAQNQTIYGNLTVQKNWARVVIKNTSTDQWSKSWVSLRNNNQTKDTEWRLQSTKTGAGNNGFADFAIEKIVNSNWMSFLSISDENNNIIFNGNNSTNETYGNIIFSSGSLGIGTWNPEYKLDVVGSIRAEEIRVQATGAPDYVFEDDYDLKTPEEIEKYIEEYGHLPEIPSAVELENQGMGLSEMNLLLLKKIEELTLHLIDQNAQLNSQRTLLEHYQRRIEEIENEIQEKWNQ